MIDRPAAKILLWENEPEVRHYLVIALHCLGYLVECAEELEEALEHLRVGGISAVLIEAAILQDEEFHILREICRMAGNVPVIVLAGVEPPCSAAEALRCGASAFLTKPVSHEQLDAALGKVLDGRNTAKSHPEPGAGGRQPLVAASPAMVRIGELLRKLGAWDVPVLIRGETGSGKEVVAREVHALSPRADKPFLKLNCAALPSELVESELFGYERGAFTGAFQKKAGMFELADEGTLLLDEIGDMEFRLQAKLLQVLQDQEFHHLGGKESIRVNVRVIAATHKDLEEAIRAGTFREDLYYRLNVVRIAIPPLRERKEDILPLCKLFLSKHAPPGTVIPPITPVLRHALISHNWPGNVRELENLMRMYLVLRDQDAVIEDLRPRMTHVPMPARAGAFGGRTAGEHSDAAPVLSLVSQAKEDAEVDAILAALNATMWCRKEAARILKVDYRALLYKMRKLKITSRAGGARAARAARIVPERASREPGKAAIARCADAGS